MRKTLAILLRLLRAIGVYACIILISLEAALRMLAPFSQTVRLALWSPSDGVQFDFIRSTDDIARFLPSMSMPGSYHAGYRLDAHGFWTEPYEEQKRPGTVRMVAIGDSFTYSSGGVPRERLWHNVAGRMLSGALKQPVDVINLGLPGAGPRLVKRVLDVEGLRLKPDIVVLGLFMGNDFTDERDERPLLVRLSYAARFLSALERLPTQLRTLHQFGGLFLAANQLSEPGQFHYDRNHKTFSDEDFFVIERDRGAYFAADSASPLHRLSADVAQVITAMKYESEEAGASFYVLLIPDEVQVNRRLRESVNAALMARGQLGVQPEEAEEIVIRSLKYNGVEVLDLLPLLTSEAEEHRSPYHLNDTHWDERGNAIAGEALAHFILAQYDGANRSLPGRR